MIDYLELKRKFRAKDPKQAESRDRSRKVVKAIAREFEQKRLESGLGREKLRRGPLYYLIIIGVMAFLLSALILVVTGKGGSSKGTVSYKAMRAKDSMGALCQALGRYKFHCGDYPTTKEGLAALAAITPRKKGWAGPYVKRINQDPWGEDYLYWRDEGSEHPVILSKGPDRRMGTLDDILPEPGLFELPFRDTTWTNHWVPYNLRGIVVAPDDETAKAIREAVKNY